MGKSILEDDGTLWILYTIRDCQGFGNCQSYPYTFIYQININPVNNYNLYKN